MKQLMILDDVPMDNPGALKKKKKSFNNCLCEILNEMMTERKLTISKISKETGIPMTTLFDWAMANSETQKLDDNIMKLARYLNVTIEYLAFGIGDEKK